ncbi:hypothetical protein Hypma_014571 [Hypsizygus marmoreus]|uniref:Uncharacterized protein n=1 Tax=Hypsizygus marmoreus TaxID=39966 RepID=A0A369JC26_HYPMA|nr:hypothetical protein Hypma_014571 [Hypsizygus marmoreus]
MKRKLTDRWLYTRNLSPEFRPHLEFKPRCPLALPVTTSAFNPPELNVDLSRLFSTSLAQSAQTLRNSRLSGSHPIAALDHLPLPTTGARVMVLTTPLLSLQHVVDVASRRLRPPLRIYPTYKNCTPRLSTHKPQPILSAIDVIALEWAVLAGKYDDGDKKCVLEYQFIAAAVVLMMALRYFLCACLSFSSLPILIVLFPFRLIVWCLNIMNIPHITRSQSHPRTAAHTPLSTPVEASSLLSPAILIIFPIIPALAPDIPRYHTFPELLSTSQPRFSVQCISATPPFPTSPNPTKDDSRPPPTTLAPASSALLPVVLVVLLMRHEERLFYLVVSARIYERWLVRMCGL